MTKITVSDFRACRVCRYARIWFEEHDLDWRDFVRNGIDVEDLRATGDQKDRIDQLEAAAKARHGKE